MGDILDVIEIVNDTVLEIDGDIVFVEVEDTVLVFEGVKETVGDIEAGITKSKYATTPEDTIEISVVHKMKIS